MSYNLSCLKCKNAFVSEDEADADGDAFCSACKEANLSIAKKVDEMIANRRVNRQPANLPNIYQQIRNKPKGSLTYMNLHGR